MNIAKCCYCQHTFNYTNQSILFSSTNDNVVESWIVCPRCDQCLFCDRDVLMSDEMLLSAFKNSVLYKKNKCCSFCSIL